jgi:two-component system NtrC family response regulator
MLLANLFLNRFSTGYRKKVRGFSNSSQKLIESYEWPGNVRELENKVQRAVIMSDAPLIEPDALGFTNQPVAEKEITLTGMTLKEARDRAEREIIASAMGNGGSMAKAAELLGISRPTLYDLMKKHNFLKSMENE